MHTTVMADPAFAFDNSRPDTLVVRSRGKVVLLHWDEIGWIEAAANYVRLHAGAREFVVRATMSVVEKKLPSQRFVRVHRSAIVNLSHVRRLSANGTAEESVVLRDGKELPIGRTRRLQLDAALRARPLADAAGNAGPESPLA